VDGAGLRTLALRCEQWSALCTGRPSSTPVAVLHAERCTSVNPAALAAGVRVGLRRREAQSRCPSLELHARDDARDARAFESVLGELERIAPRLEVLEPGRCAFPTRGPSRYHGGDRSLAALVHERVTACVQDRFGADAAAFPVGVGIADGPLAASIAAQESIRSGSVPVVVPTGATASFLSGLPVELLVAAGRDAPGEAEELVGVWRRLGLRTIGRVAALPAPDVVARFGELGARLHRLATGSELDPARLGPAPVDLRVAAAVEPPAERVDRAAFVAASLADTLHTELARRGLACARVLVVAETDAGDRIERLWRHEGALSAAAISQRVRWQLEGWLGTGRSRSRCSGGVSRIELVPDQVLPDAGVQLGFWGGSSEAGERAVRALARVQGLVGPGSVLVPEWRGGRGPGEQYRLVPLDTVDPAARSTRGEEPWPGRLPPPSPAVVWPSVRPAELLDAAGQRVGVGGRGLLSAPPARASLEGGGWLQVRAWAGPWCIDERWWDAVAHRRRARLQVVLAEPDQHHPSRATAHLMTLEDRRWWVEATYD
jgi:protein ImuB